MKSLAVGAASAVFKSSKNSATRDIIEPRSASICDDRYGPRVM
jgi:hypothetical protein